jgi:hypothetical protein
MMTKYNKDYVKVNGEEIPYYRIDNDLNGNPRYVTHFLDLGIKPNDYGKVPGLSKYRGKWFGGGYVIQSYNLGLLEGFSSLNPSLEPLKLP